MMLKKILLFLLLSLSSTVPAMDYSVSSNWLIAEKNKKNTDFDVFYVHPTLLKDAKNPFPDFNNPKVYNRLKNFSAAQTGIFGSRARVFVPAVRQLEITRCLKEINSENTDGISEKSLQYQAVQDTVKAFKYYLKRYNHNGRRPYILIGHSQGAMDLYELLRKVPEIRPEKGFVAAYLLGMPRVTAKKIEADLGLRGIYPARDEGSTGVVIVWNTQTAQMKKNMFTVPGGYGINPLNWRTDTLKGSGKLHKGITLFDHRKMQTRSAVNPDGSKMTCAAQLDENGGLTVENLPAEAKKLYAGAFGPGCCHAGDLWIFAENIVENVKLRVSLYRQKKELDRAKLLIRTGKAECVLIRNGKIQHVERGRGVSPLLHLYDREQARMRGGIIVDKVIGRAAAAIAICGRAEFVHAEIISEDAQSFLKEHGISSSHMLFVPRILNRKKDGLCPLEQSVSGIENPQKALEALRKRIAEIMKAAGRK